jgi:AraC family transcriptional regulator, transcriptional activator of the genes for pyochelin and ferripyochelin receptors
MQGTDVRLIHALKEDGGNAPEWSLSRQVIDEGLSLYHTQGQKDKVRRMRVVLPKGILFFQFHLGEGCELKFSPHYSQHLKGSELMLLYNPEKELDFICELAPESNTAFILTTVSTLHTLIVQGADDIPFLNAQSSQNKYYMKQNIAPSMRFSLEQLFSNEISNVASRLYLSGKAYELLGHYFNKDEKSDYLEACPFLRDQRNVEAVRKCRQILMERLENPPTIKELSTEVGLNEYQLKVGFKNIYGKTINGYYQDHRITYALKLMTEDGLMVQEAASKIGYSNVSHFIAAFKKKFKVTPKQYLLS